MNDSNLLVPEGDLQPVVLTGDRSAISAALDRWCALGLTVRVVRGRTSRRLEGLFDEFSAALQFPLYFGRNRNAFDECIADLDWLPHDTGIVIVVAQPEELLADAAPSELAWLASSLANAARGFSEAIDLGEWWDRPPLPFHVVFAGEQAAIDQALMRWPRPLDYKP
jgi:hypothetical protein